MSIPKEGPQVQCPACGQWQPDYDGFGFLACDYCGYCKHPCATGDADGDMVCDICGYIVERKQDTKGKA